MSERNIEQMMKMLRESGEGRPDFEKKTQEVIDNLENEEAKKFLKVFAAIELAEQDQQADFDSTGDLSARLHDLAYERLKEDHYEYFDRMTVELTKAARIYGQYLRIDGKSVYENFIDEDVRLPTIKQFEKCITSGFDQFLLIPKIKFENIESRLEAGLGLIEGGLFFPLNIDTGKHQGDAHCEIIALQRFITNAADGIGNKSGSNDLADKKHFEWRRAVNEHLVLGQDETMSLQGLTLKEYFMMQLVHLNEQVKVNHGMAHPPSKIQLLDNVPDQKAAILTESWSSRDNNGEFLSVRWDQTTRQLIINPPFPGKITYFPWYAIHFDKIKDNTNESGA